jgi:hypothetical protein
VSAQRRSGPIVFALVVVLVAGAIGLTVTGRLPFIAEAWRALPFGPARSAPVSGAPDASPRAADAGRSKRSTASLSSAQLGAPLVNSSFITACGAPDDMKVVLNVAVKMGHAVQVDVKTDPPDSTVAACVDKAVHEMTWDVSPKTKHLTVTY